MTWFAPEAERLLVTHHIARVAADPALVPVAGVPGGWPGVVYYRLHGSPRMYASAYGSAFVKRLAQRLADIQGDAPVWSIFDNTAEGAATEDALRLQQKLQDLLPLR